MAQEITTSVTIFGQTPNAGIVSFVIETPSTTDTGDTIVLTLSNYGISATGLLEVFGQVHTTANSVLVTEAPTTSVTSGVLTITVGGSTVSDKKRTYRVTGKSGA